MSKEQGKEMEPLRRDSGVGVVWQSQSGCKVYTRVAQLSIAFDR